MKRTSASATVFALFGAGLLSGAWLGSAALARAQDPYEDLALFARVLSLVQLHYVDEPGELPLIESAVDGLLDELDPHSRYLSAAEYRSFQESSRGSYEGIGVEVRIHAQGVLIARVLPGGPAERDGLVAGDILTHADGESLVGLALDEVSKRLKAPRGTPLTITVLREGWDEPRDIETVRDRIHTPAVYAERLSDQLVYARLVQFSESTATELEQKVGDLGPADGLVLDLRDNSGGLLDQAVDVTDLFLDDGIIVSTRGRRDPEKVYEASIGGFSPDLQVAVLVNGMSASASEIVAAALQDSGRAPLIGEQTYGKGSVQVLFENPDESAVKLTIGRYYTPSGEPVAARHGRVPDIEVSLTGRVSAYDELRAALTTEEALSEERRAELTALLDTLPRPDDHEVDIAWDESAAERMQTDAQLEAAVDWLIEALAKP